MADGVGGGQEEAPGDILAPRERIRQLRDRALKQLKEQHGDRLKDLAA